jgi:hypothetical protein
MYLLFLIIIIFIFFLTKERFTNNLNLNKYYLWILINNITLSSSDVYDLVKNLNTKQENYLSKIKIKYGTKLSKDLIKAISDKPKNYKTANPTQLKFLMSNLASSQDLFSVFADSRYFNNINKLSLNKTMDENVKLLTF